jgi:hypothetical protein
VTSPIHDEPVKEVRGFAERISQMLEVRLAMVVQVPGIADSTSAIVSCSFSVGITTETLHGFLPAF